MKTKLSKKQVTKLFIMFLKRKNALIPFIVNLAVVEPVVKKQLSNIKKQNKCTLTEYIHLKSIFHQNHYHYQERLITDSFKWRYSTEGVNYWANISIEWKEYLTMQTNENIYNSNN